MEDFWPSTKLERIHELVSDLRLPPHGIALDYGCGDGVFTDALRRTLPGWRIYGTDVSDIALEKAATRFPECSFLSLERTDDLAGRVDFLFTHHVLEHVFDLDRTLGDALRVVAATGTVMHVLPCGNAGSLEHRLCREQRDGRDPSAGNRFFFEGGSEGHVRRLDTEGLADAMAPHGFELARARYACHYFGALQWMTECDISYIRGLTRLSTARSARARLRLAWIRAGLLALRAARYPSLVYPKIGRLRNRVLRSVIRVAGYAPYRLSLFVDRWLDDRCRAEWAERQEDPAGSEMYLFFQRAPTFRL